VVQPPTLSREDLVAAIDKFQMQRATAIGSAIVIALAELFPDQGIDLDTVARASGRPRATPIDAAPKKPQKEFTPVAPGSYNSAAIILLTDGQRTTGVDTLEAAKMAADRGVRIYTVGIGTVDGETIGFEGWSMRVRLDEETLKKIAQQTQGEYFYAGTAENLKAVYEKLGSRLTVEKKETEISGLLALAGGRTGAAGGRVVTMVARRVRRAAGASGSGKSTLLNILGGLDVPTSGDVCASATTADRRQRGRAHALPARARGLRVPVLQPDPQPDGARERRPGHRHRATTRWTLDEALAWSA
jgi:hypothetical protein